MSNFQNIQLFINKFDIFPLETKSTINRYRLVNNYCDVEINDNVKKIIDIINENYGIYYDDFIVKCKEFFNSDISELNKILKLLFNKGIITNEMYFKNEQENELTYYRNRFHFLWLRIKLIDTEKYRETIKKLSFTFSKHFFLSVLVLFFAAELYFIILSSNKAWLNSLHYYSNFEYIYILSFSVVMTFIHELGHITAAIKYGAKTGGIGFGIYFYFPVAYADVHESWNLSLKQRRIVSIGGLYYNLIFLIPFYCITFYTKSKGMFDFIIACHFAAIFLFNPFLKMDGYWFLSDVLGIPNLKTKIQLFKQKYLYPKLLNKPTDNIFRYYPRNIKRGVIIYLVFSQLFMFTFISFLLYTGAKLLINIHDYINQFNQLIVAFNTEQFNHLIHNILILIIFFRILYVYSKNIIKRIFR